MSVTTRDLDYELGKLKKINKVLMDRVERNMDAQIGNAFSLFQTAITLEGKISERTRELTRLTHRLMHEISHRRRTEEALRAAKNEAEQANIGKTQFLAAASHDLHQPLNAARLFLGVLADEVPTGRPRDLVGRVETALDAVTDLINTVLDISRLDSGAWAVAPTTFAIAPFLAQLAAEYGPQATACGLDLHIETSTAYVHTDRALFRRAMTNLVSNAIRYTDRGRILIGCRRRQGKLRVEVWDTGIGIMDTLRPYIFEEFRQVGTPPRHDEKGFGLGLAIVDRIVRRLGLSIDVRSRIGRGSCFSIVVPCGNPADAVPEPLLQRPAVRDQAFAGISIGCIGNDPQTQAALVVLLQSWGCRPVTAPDLNAVLQAAGPGPDLILAGDLGLDTIETCRRLFARTIPAIVLSQDRTADTRAAVEALGYGYLEKPLQPAKLRAMMVHMLDQEPVA